MNLLAARTELPLVLRLDIVFAALAVQIKRDVAHREMRRFEFFKREIEKRTVIRLEVELTALP